MWKISSVMKKLSCVSFTQMHTLFVSVQRKVRNMNENSNNTKNVHYSIKEKSDVRNSYESQTMRKKIMKRINDYEMEIVKTNTDLNAKTFD